MTGSGAFTTRSRRVRRIRHDDTLRPIASHGPNLQLPHCDLAIIKPGSWFQSVRQFNCQGCKREVRITYVDKVALFEKHAHLGRFKRS